MLLILFVMFVYRDVWPLATYDQLPEDRAEGPLLWITGFVLTMAAVMVPLISPRKYKPRKLEVCDYDIYYRLSLVH